MGREESVLERVDWLERAEVGGRRMRRGRGGVAGLGFAACLHLLPFAWWAIGLKQILDSFQLPGSRQVQG